MNQSDYEIRLLHQLTGFLAELTTKAQGLHSEHPFMDWLLKTSATCEQRPIDYNLVTQQVIALFTHYTDMAPLFPRDVLYFLGGDCLHFMPDEEIAAYQALDEMRFEALAQRKTFDWEHAKESLKKLQ
jgi:hypothetical protein